MTPSQVKRHFDNNITEAARRLSMSRRVIYKWLNNGSIPARTQVWIEQRTNGALRAAK
jgi:DNA invertase Pin-like site-specific DNA recombinase